MIIAFTGGRDFEDKKLFSNVVKTFCARHLKGGFPDFAIVGDASGLDAMALKWCQSNKIDHAEMYAKWNKYDKRAGMIRNKAMLDLLRVDYLLAFPGNAGTNGMCALAKAARIPIFDARDGSLPSSSITM